MNAPTYQITRLYTDENHPEHRRVVRTGLTLRAAQLHCRREDTHEFEVDGMGIKGKVIWFDSYDKAGRT